MDKIDRAKKIIKENFHYAAHDIFDSRNTAGNRMSNLYTSDELVIDICYYYEYFEVFGLNDIEFKELADFYYSLKEVYLN